MTTFIKDPQSVLDYQFDWSLWLAAENDDVINSFALTVPEGITLGTNNEVSGKVTFFLSGGTPGVTYPITCQITTAAQRIIDRSFDVDVQQR
jgi:hypothetical protein